MPPKLINIETRIKALNRVVDKLEQQEVVTQALQSAKGDWNAASAKLKDKLPPESLHRLHIADLVATAVGDQPEVAKAILGQSDIRTIRDVANLTVDQLTKLIAPDGQPGTDVHRQARDQATAINKQSFAREPLTVLQRMIGERELPIAEPKVQAGLGTFLKSISPDTDIRLTPIHRLLTADALKDVPEEQRPAVVNEAKALWRTLPVTPPDAPQVPPILMRRNLTSAFHIGEKPESAFLKMCGQEMGEETARQVYTNAVNTRIRNEHALITLREAIRGTGLAAIDGKRTREERLADAKRYAATNDIPLNLNTLFADMDYCECKDCQSVYSASAYFVELLNFLRNNNLDPDNPQAYQKGIEGTPLENLFRRRPDLGGLELTCENTNAVLPYIDLANEVMESYVVHRVGYAESEPKLDVFNVRDETKEELLAQPQHTNYLAYCILKNEAVYPFTLPFHQPIEAARIFLKYLGTSRYEVVDTFRAARGSVLNLEKVRKTISDTCAREGQPEPKMLKPEEPLRGEPSMEKLHSKVLDRAADAEFLALTQEEYIILTKEAFWPKQYFEIPEKTTLAVDEYRRNIGVRQPWEYYGYSNKSAMLDTNEDPVTGRTGLNFVKNAFLRRTGIQYTDLVDLLKTRFINPLYPKGMALGILEKIQGSYRFLQNLVNSDPAVTDPKIKFTELINFLETGQTWDSVPQVLQAFSHVESPKAGASRENPVIRQWVYSWFEKLGKLTVLESGEGRQLPVEGLLYLGEARNPFGKLLRDGTIVNYSDGVRVGAVSVEIVNDEGGHPRACAGPVHWTWQPLAEEIEKGSLIRIMDESGKVIGGVSRRGLTIGAGEKLMRVPWLETSDTCDLDKVRLLHLDGSPVTPDEFDRMQRFIRLWRKLGWTMDEVDKALEGLARKSIQPRSEVKESGGVFLDSEVFQDIRRPSENPASPSGVGVAGNVRGDITPDFLHQLVAVKKLLERTGLPVIKLLSFWADVSTTGEKSLYAQLFLRHNMLSIDSVVQPDDNGNYLTGSARISEHLPVLMGALKLKGDQITTLVGMMPAHDITPGTGAPDAPLTLPNVSFIYRYGLLAKALQIRVSDLPNLRSIHDPFQDAHTTLKLFEMWQKMENAGCTFRQIIYVLKDVDDAQKPFAPSQKTILQVAKTLYDALHAIARDNPDVTDLEEATADLVRTKAGLLFEPAVVEQILGLLEGTTTYKKNAPPKEDLKIPDSFAGKLVYRCQEGAASIQVTGLLTDTEKSDAKALCATDPEWPEAIDRVYKQARSFFKNALGDILPEKSTDDDAQNNRVHPLAGDVNVPADQVPAGQPDPNTARQKRLYFLHYYLPKLRERLEERAITETISAATGLPGDVTKALLAEVISAGTSSQSAMEALRRIKENPGPGSAWKGYLIPPVDGNYAFLASVSDQDPSHPPVPLALDGFHEPIRFINQPEESTDLWSTDPVSLKGGELYLLTLRDRDAAQLQWRTTGSPATPIPTSALLPNYTNAGTKDAFTKVCKAAILVNGFNLSADEVRYFQAQGADFDGFDFNAVKVESLLRIADYNALRKALPKAGLPLLELFKWASKGENAAQLVEKLNAVTQWKEDRIRGLIAENHFDLQRPADFKTEANLVRMQKAIGVADKVGVDVDRLFTWAVPGSKFWPCHQIAEDIRMAMRARFDAEIWEEAVKPLNDQLREMQKQALVSFLLIQPELRAWPVVDADSLFEFFLIDVQMGAERQTSRMVQAIASVQLFIKRCLMGLEEKYGVKSGDIDRDRWEWMQKYRVWEANRKVFLYPENWIRPELRDDKSPFYKELESELLQKDISAQTVQDALKNYLYKVDEVANLKVVGLYIEPAGGSGGEGFADKYSKLHLFARARSAPYFFYYRYFDTRESNWYPWEKMQVDIPSYDVEETDEKGAKTGRIRENGTFLIPAMWNNRLLVFFPQFMKKTIAASSDQSVRQMAESTSSNLQPTELWEIKMAWSEYRKGKWTQKQVSTEAIYDKILPNHPLSSYMFFPAIITDPLPKIGIEVYRKIESYTPPEPPEPQPVLLQSANLTTEAGSTPLKGIDVRVTSLVDNRGIASKGSEQVDLTIPGSPPPKDQCKSLRVNVSVSPGWKPGNIFLFKKFTVTLTFTDNEVLEAKREVILFPIVPDKQTGALYYAPSSDTFVYLYPEGPEIDSAMLVIDTTGDDGKNHDTWFDVSVCDQNGAEFAGITDAGQNIPYNKGDHKTVPLTIYKKLKESECQGFTVKITEHPHNLTGWDTWQFAATVNLSFGASTLKASKTGIVLRVEMNSSPQEASVSFASTDRYVPPAEPAQPEPESNPTVTDVPINRRFEFAGNGISVVDIRAHIPVQNMDLRGYHFHYRDLEDWKAIRSLQTEDGEALSLAEEGPFSDDPQPRFYDPQPRFSGTDSIFRVSNQQYTFSDLAINKLLMRLNSDKLEDLFNYYSALYTDPDPDAMAFAFGGYTDGEGGKSYDELKQPYSLYNWEVCFHAPMQLVDHLLKTQQFDQALVMCHYVFNPLARPNPADPADEVTRRCWQFPPFKGIDAKRVLENLFHDLRPGEPDDKITAWREKPFQPHLVARGRPSAYMKYVVMKYIEILIAYGDYYFRQNTMESIPLAIQCYVMASHLYGPRGQRIPRRGKTGKQTYNSLLDKWDAFGNAMVEMELAFPFTNQGAAGVNSANIGLANVFGSISTLYFGIPNNPNLTALRDTIDDRLLKIRSCENIEGIFQQLPLFEPPIDPALLVQAAAQGLSLSSVLNDMNSPMPNYRFYYLLQKALELCSELKTLGNAFLSAKEKGDAEALANMRAGHESGMQNLLLEVRKQQVEEACKSLDALEQNRKGPVSRMQYYLQLIGEDLSKVPDGGTDFSDLPNQLEQPIDASGLKLIRYEKEEMDRANEARDWQLGIGVAETLASILHIIPDFSLDAKYLGVGAGTLWGGVNLGNAAQAIARGLQVYATDLSYQSTNAGRKGAFLRQLQDRVQQANAAGYEIKNVDKQILTQQIRIAIANQEIKNQQHQIDNAREMEEFLRNKYTNAELYSWMEENIRTLYHQAYTLAYDLAKKAEKAYRFERGLSDSSFIQFGYWDSGRDGLLAGERLYLALKQLEAAYQEKRGYDYEITKHVSLRQINPLALLNLRESGMCEFALPEVLFDMDHPGHYLRRIKSLALTLPCIVGPYTSLNCTLRMLEHRFRINTQCSSANDYAQGTIDPEERFSTVNVPITAIAVSTGQNDSGVFELNFRDERYIPFEGAGAISKWRLELPEKFRQFDYETISDVVMHLRYTAVDGGNKLKTAAAGAVSDYIKSLEDQEGLFAIFDLRSEFSSEWQKATQSEDRLIALGNLNNRLPFFAKNGSTAKDAYLFTPSSITAEPILKTSAGDASLKGGPTILNMRSWAWEDIDCGMDGWQITLPDGTLDNDKVWLVVRYGLDLE